MLLYELTVLVLILFYVFIFLFYLFGWITLPEFQPTASSPHTRVSIIISCRNEEKNIRSLLSDLLNQSYPENLSEIIVVDDFSEDRTGEIVLSFNDPRIQLLQLKNFIGKDERVLSYKKKALEVGIAHSTADLIVTTDADCRVSDHWLNSLVNFYEEKKCRMVVAPVLMKDENSFLEKFQALDVIGLMGITGATLNLNFPTMCNGANLAFQRKSFYEVNGYEGIAKTSSGDDMLLMHKIAAKWKRGVAFLKNANAIVYTLPQKSISSFIRQRMRWTSKSQHYSDSKIKFNLLIVYLFNLLILASAVLSFFKPQLLIFFILQISVKLILDFVFLSHVTKFFNRHNLMWLFLPIEVLHIFYIIFVGFAGNFFKTNWKGRAIK